MCTSGFHDSTCKSCEGDRWCESGSNLEKTCDHVREPTTPPRLSQRSGGVIYSPADLPVGTRRRRRPLETDGVAAHLHRPPTTGWWATRRGRTASSPPSPDE